MPKVHSYKQNLFIEYKETDATGKNVLSLERSRAIRYATLKLFNGHLPESIMRAKRGSRKSDDPDAVRTYDESAHYPAHAITGFRTSGKGVGRSGKKQRVIPEGAKKAFHNSGQGARGGALSAFPQNVGRSVVLLYTEPGQIVVDPFAGHNSRMQLCVEAGRHYVGYDISRQFMETNAVLRTRLLRENPGMKIALHLQDSRNMKFTKDGFGDFTITSPPYYDLEYYGDEPEQLGKAPTYEEFLHELGKIAEENFRVLKSGAYAVWFVNDFRAKGRFFLYHIDTLKLLTNAGFVPHDMMIVDFGPPFGSIFLQTTIQRRYLPKRHEYGLVVRKP